MMMKKKIWVPRVPRSMVPKQLVPWEENDRGIEQKIKTPTEQEDPTEQEEKTASAEAVENGDTQDKTMEDSNLDLTGTTPAVSTKQQDTDEKSETEEGEITNEEVANKNKNENTEEDEVKENDHTSSIFDDSTKSGGQEEKSSEKEAARSNAEKKTAVNRKKKEQKKKKKKEAELRQSMSEEERIGGQELKRNNSGKEISNYLVIRQAELTTEIEKAHKLIDSSEGPELEDAQGEMVHLLQLRKEIFPSDDEGEMSKVDEKERSQELTQPVDGRKSFQEVKREQVALECKIEEVKKLLETGSGASRVWARDEKV